MLNTDSIIKNINIPACRNCIHYIPSSYNKFEDSMNRCGKFGEKNIITNEIKYDYVDLCRQSESQCGKEGKYFEEEPNIELKIMKHRLLSQWSTFYFSIFVGYILVYYLNK
jgi:hypothetical protein